MAYAMIAIRLQSTVHWLSFGPGIFGWTAIQVHVNMMDMQLHTMFHIDLVPYVLVPGLKNDGTVSTGSSGAVGREKAPVRRVKANER